MGKRGNGEVSISRRKDGLYRTRYTVETDGSEEKDGIREDPQSVSEKLTAAIVDASKGIKHRRRA